MAINPDLRFYVLKKLSGMLTDMVKTTFPETSSQTFSAVSLNLGKGTSCMIPANPISADHSVNILINIRGIQGSDTKTASNLGVNAVVITAEAGGKGSKENIQTYDSNFVNNSVGQVINYLKKQDPEVKLGKLALAGFSGGGSAVANVLTQSSSLNYPISNVIISDGLHAEANTPAMKAIMDYAQDAAQNPDQKNLTVLHSAIVPGYRSTTQTADQIVQGLGMTRQSQVPSTWNGQPPKSIAQKGGVKVVQMYDKSEPYFNDPKRGAEAQHWQTRKAYLNNMPGLLGWQ